MRLLFLHLTLYSGLFCETPPPMVLLQTSPCDNYECQNGAQCIVAHQEPVCRCLAGFAGQKCEKLITVNFVGKDSYVELPSAKIRPQANISLQVCHADYLLLVLFWEITLSTSTKRDSWRLLSSPLTLKISHLNAAGLVITWVDPLHIHRKYVILVKFVAIEGDFLKYQFIEKYIDLCITKNTATVHQ